MNEDIRRLNKMLSYSNNVNSLDHTVTIENKQKLHNNQKANDKTAIIMEPMQEMKIMSKIILNKIIIFQRPTKLFVCD